MTCKAIVSSGSEIIYCNRRSLVLHKITIDHSVIACNQRKYCI